MQCLMRVSPSLAQKALPGGGGAFSLLENYNPHARLRVYLCALACHDALDDTASWLESLDGNPRHLSHRTPTRRLVKHPKGWPSRHVRAGRQTSSLPNV